MARHGKAGRPADSWCVRIGVVPGQIRELLDRYVGVAIGGLDEDGKVKDSTCRIG